MNGLLFSACLLVSSSVLIGCGYSGEQVHVEFPSALPASTEARGVELGARPFFDPDDAQDVFGHEVVFEQRTLSTTTYGYLPVLVSFNNDTGAMLVVRKDLTRLVSGDGKRSRPRSWERMFEAMVPSLAGAYLAGGVVGLALQDDANQDMAEDWRDKELPDQTLLYPESTGVGGFLYFKDKGGQAPYHLEVVVEDPVARSFVTLRVRLDG